MRDPPGSPAGNILTVMPAVKTVLILHTDTNKIYMFQLR